MKLVVLGILWLIGIGQSSFEKICDALNLNCSYCQNETEIVGKLKIEVAGVEKRKAVAYEYQNKAFNAEEVNRDFNTALVYIDTALAIWCASKDTLNIANLLKYKGYLLAYLQKLNEGKCLIYKSIVLYKARSNANGETVAKFNLSKLYEVEENYDSSFYFIHESLTHWNIKKDTSRIVTSLNQLLNLHIKTASYNEANKIQKQITSLIEGMNLHWRQIIDFYILSARYYARIHNDTSAKEYITKYEELKSAINVQSAITSSPYYEP